MAAAGPVISAWSAVSAFGVGRQRFSDGLRSGRNPATVLDPAQWATPVQQACLVPDGSPRELLGRKGTRSMDRATALAVSAIGRLLDERTGGSGAGTEGDTALVLGTSNGSAQSIMAFTRDSLTEDKPFFVDPARFPNTVMNCAAGQSAIWYGLRGANVTIAGGRAAALLALNHARRLQRSGRARTVVCGAVEEFSAERAWLEWHARRDGEASPHLGEGCAVLLLDTAEAPGRPALAEVTAVEVGLAAQPEEVSAVLTGCVRRALAHAHADVPDLWAVAASGPPGPLGDHERAALDEILGRGGATHRPDIGVLGDTNAASFAFQLSALLAAAEQDPQAIDRAALLTTVDRDGLVGCALLRLGSGAHR